MPALSALALVAEVAGLTATMRPTTAHTVGRLQTQEDQA